MKAFSFKLKTLLHLRDIEKQNALSSYGRSVRERENIEKTLLNKRNYLENLKEQVAKRRTFNFTGYGEEVFQRSVKSTLDQILQIHGELENAKKIENAKRNLFLTAESRFKSLEKLKEKKRLEHQSAELQKEESELEDIVGSRFVYNLKLSHSP